MVEGTLVDRQRKQAFEVKLTDGTGYKGFSLLSDQQELQGFTFTLLEGESFMQHIYRWGRSSYQGR